MRRRKVFAGWAPGQSGSTLEHHRAQSRVLLRCRCDPSRLRPGRVRTPLHQVRSPRQRTRHRRRAQVDQGRSASPRCRPRWRLPTTWRAAVTGTSKRYDDVGPRSRLAPRVKADPASVRTKRNDDTLQFDAVNPNGEHGSRQATPSRGASRTQSEAPIQSDRQPAVST